MNGLSVLVIEDSHRAHRGELANNLRSDGFHVTTATTLATCLEQLSATSPAIALIDMDFSDSTGLEACHQVRLRSPIPIIAIADPDSPIDAIATLEMGADDHVLRPYRPSELTARMRATLRRTTTHHPLGTPSIDAAVVVDHVALDPMAHEVYVDERPVQLTLKEFELLHLLMVNAGKVLARETLMRNIWHRDAGRDTKTLDVHIKRLREKIDVADRGKSMIVTVRGLGYRFERDTRATVSAARHSNVQ